MAAIAAVYAGFWYHGVCFGARYYYALLPYFGLFTVSGIIELPEIVKDRFSLVIPALARIVFTLAILLFGFSLLIYIPLVSLVSPYHDFCDFHGQVHAYVERQRMHNAIVFIRPGGESALPGVIANEVEIARSDVVFAGDCGSEENQKIIDRFPGRSVYYYKHRKRESYVRERLRKLGIRRLSEQSSTSVNNPKLIW
jgi:hypothetical protein